MKTTHLSPWEQEECVIDRPTPQMLRHLNECAECRGAVERLQRSTEIFRSAAMEWSAESLAARPQQLQMAAASQASRRCSALGHRRGPPPGAAGAGVPGSSLQPAADPAGCGYQYRAVRR